MVKLKDLLFDLDIDALETEVDACAVVFRQSGSGLGEVLTRNIDVDMVAPILRAAADQLDFARNVSRGPLHKTKQ